MNGALLKARFLSLFRQRRVMLWLAWILSLILGTLCAAFADPSLLAMMRLAASGRMSIVGVAAACFLPFLISAYAVFIDRPGLMAGVCACKAFGFAYCGGIARRAFGSAGWLVQPLLQFSSVFTLPLLCCFCLRHISGGKKNAVRDLLICIGLTAALAGIDYFVVSPFLAELIDR